MARFVVGYQDSSYAFWKSSRDIPDWVQIVRSVDDFSVLPYRCHMNGPINHECWPVGLVVVCGYGIGYMKSGISHIAGFISHGEAMKKRSGALHRKDSDRVERLRNLTMAQAIREMEVLCSFPWPIRRRTDPPVPSRRFITD